jgi:hypothetical protein
MAATFPHTSLLRPTPPPAGAAAWAALVMRLPRGLALVAEASQL